MAKSEKKVKTRANKLGNREVKCPKCGYGNPDEAIFCLKCGAKLGVADGGAFEGLVFLHLAGSLYVLLSAALNALVQASTVILALYIVPGVLGLYVAYTLHTRRAVRWTKFLSLTTVTLGLVGTLLLFIIGLRIRRVVGPAWIIFLITGWKLWRDRYEF